MKQGNVPENEVHVRPRIFSHNLESQSVDPLAQEPVRSCTEGNE